MTPLSLAFVAPHGEGALRSRLGEESVLGFGGAEIQMALLGTGLAARGHRVAFLCAGSRQEVEEEDLGPLRLLRIPMGGKLGEAPQGSIQAWLRRGLESAGAEMVYQRCALPLTGRVAWECSRSRRSFVFAVANDRDVDGRMRQTLGLRRYLMYRYGLQRADLVVVQSRQQRACLGRRLRARSLLLPSVIDLDGITAYSDGTGDSVLWVGNILPKKRPWELLDLARQMPDVKFIAAGSSTADPDLGAEFRRQAESLSNLEYAGQIPHAGMDSLYRRAALLLNTSAAEGMPNTFLEAWARSIPVVTTGIDPDGLLDRQKLGFILPHEDAHRGLRRILEDAPGRRATGRRGRAHVLSQHALPVVVQQFAEELDALRMPG